MKHHPDRHLIMFLVRLVPKAVMLPIRLTLWLFDVIDPAHKHLEAIKPKASFNPLATIFVLTGVVLLGYFFYTNHLSKTLF